MDSELARETFDGTLIISVDGDAESPCRIAIAGELDLANAKTLSAELERVCADGGVDVIFDLSGLEFIDSTGLALLVEAHHRFNDGSERLRFVPSDAAGVKRVLEVTGLDATLPFIRPSAARE